MNAVRRLSLFRVIASIAALILIANPLLMRVEGQLEELTNIPIGLEISARLKEAIIQHKEAISSYIMEAKIAFSKTDEERLQIIDQYHQLLRQRIQLINQDRSNLLEMLRKGGISPEEFALQMRRLKSESYGLSLLSGKIGYRLGEIGKWLSENLTLAVEELVEANKYFSEYMKEMHEQIKEEISIGMYKANIRNLTECSKLKAFSNVLSKAITRLEELKERLSKKIEGLRDNVSEINKYLQQASPNSSQCIELLSNLTARLNRVEDDIFNLNRTRNELLKRLNQLNGELEQHIEKRGELEKKIKELENQYQRVNSERNELERSLNNKKIGESERQRVRERLQELLREMERTDKEKKECNELMNEVEERVENNLKAVGELKNATKRFMEEIRMKIREREKLLEIIRELRERCGGENRTMIKMYIIKSFLERKLEFLEKEYRGIEVKLEILSNWLSEVNHKIGRACQEATEEKT